MNKSTLRAFHIARRNQISLIDRQLLSDRIRDNTQLIINWNAVGFMHVYQSNSRLREVDTAWVGASVYSMWSNIKLTIGEASPTAAIPDDRHDVIIVPIVAFSANSLQRIGFGGGWYDRFLAEQPHAVKIGLAYDFQRDDKMIVEPHDMPLDYIVTESTIFKK